MKFLQRLFAKPVPPSILSGRLIGPGSFEIKVTELSIRNLDLFWNATSNEWRHNEEDRDFYERVADAKLVSDFEHRLPHAVRVEIAGTEVGHLEHADALRLHRRLKELGYDGITSKCDANVVGRTGYWEMHVDLDIALARIKPASSDSQS